MKKWILKSEIEKILNAYSIRKDEFAQVSDINYCYQSKFIRGYMITLSQEPGTKRILVSHSQDDGKRTYIDVWERKGDELQFRFRNLWNQPLADAEYIADLENRIEELKQAGAELQARLQNLQENQKLISATVHTHQPVTPAKPDDKPKNERGAGRKPSPERKNAIAHMQRLLQAGISEQEIMAELGISRATFYRYKKSILN